MDWNVQCDTRAAAILAAAAQLTLVTLPVTLEAHLRAADLGRLRDSGPLGRLLARQAQAHGEEYGMADVGRAHARLPDDLVNFHYDPVACAVALGWPGATVEEMRLRPARSVAPLERPVPEPPPRPVPIPIHQAQPVAADPARLMLQIKGLLLELDELRNRLRDRDAEVEELRSDLATAELLIGRRRKAE